MNWKGHVIFGVIILALIVIIDRLYLHFFFQSLNLMFWIVYSPLILFSFLLPDIDHDSSKPRVLVTILLLIVTLFYAIKGNYYYVIAFLVILILLWIMNKIKGWQHRGHAHSIIFIFIISLIVVLSINWKVAIVFFFGAFTHLIADAEFKFW